MIDISNTYGLIVCGGRSARMHMDKSKLVYFEKEQRYHLADMLSPYFDKCFISCSEQQQTEIDPAYPFITDHPEYSDIGPMAALLSAFKNFPTSDLFVLACDYPFITNTEIENFFASGSHDFACAFYNTAGNVYEPYIGWYSHKAAPMLQEMFLRKEYSLQHFLKNNDAGRYFPLDAISIRSIDDIISYEQAKVILSKRVGN